MIDQAHSALLKRPIGKPADRCFL